MGFKKASEFNSARYGNKFILQNDGDSADVVFLYRSEDDILIADAHYIKSNSYNGYVHCCEAGCPACAKNIRVQQKLFIPLYNVSSERIEFWDRTPIILPQLTKDIFRNYPNPSEYVFRITRHGESGDRGTRYQIVAVGRNTQSYDKLLSNLGAVMPDYYENIIKDASAADISKWLESTTTTYGGGNSDSLPEYTPTPRVPITTTANPVDDVLSGLDKIDDFEEIDSEEDPGF